MILSFGSEMGKLAYASPRDLYAQKRRDEAFKKLKKSNEPDAARKAFMQGFVASAAVPAVLYGLQTPLLQPDGHIKYVNDIERQVHLSKAFQVGGVAKKEADQLSSALANIMGDKPTKHGHRMREALKTVVSSEIQGGAPNLIKDWSGNWAVKKVNVPKNFVSGNVDVLGILKKGFGTFDAKNPYENYKQGFARVAEGLAAANNGQPLPNDKVFKIINDNVFEPTAERIAKDKFPNIFKQTQAAMNPQSYEKLLTVGREAYQKGGRKFPEYSTYFKGLMKHLKRSAPVPLLFGLIGGAAAVSSQKEKKKEYNELLRRSRARR